ncbi:unnamed protein product [Protopolystoma xenopodis]|uniref:Uncharacterized protein n=1 Tax=Protopolystoma xenopodis TaxID=117903 RepID=A0A3S5A3M4_9PLAT|nr:unnamed protein product [Protopolystoma xenopodis]
MLQSCQRTTDVCLALGIHIHTHTHKHLCSSLPGRSPGRLAYPFTYPPAEATSVSLSSVAPRCRVQVSSSLSLALQAETGRGSKQTGSRVSSDLDVGVDDFSHLPKLPPAWDQLFILSVCQVVCFGGDARNLRFSPSSGHFVCALSCSRQEDASSWGRQIFIHAPALYDSGPSQRGVKQRACFLSRSLFPYSLAFDMHFPTDISPLPISYWSTGPSVTHNVIADGPALPVFYPPLYL